MLKYPQKVKISCQGTFKLLSYKEKEISSFQAPIINNKNDHKSTLYNLHDNCASNKKKAAIH